MTTTPRQLSDAIQADYEEILESRPEETRRLERWRAARLITGWMMFSYLAVCVTPMVLALTTWSLAWLSVAILFGFVAPLILVPGITIWTVAAVTMSRLESGQRSHMFTTYGITVDRTVTPAVYSVSGIPVTWLKPELRRTRELLAGLQMNEPTGNAPSKAEPAVEKE